MSTTLPLLNFQPILLFCLTSWASINDSVRTELDVYAGIPHGFTLFPDLPAAQLGLKRSAQAVKWILEKKPIE